MRFENLAMFMVYCSREGETMPFNTVDRDGVMIGKFTIKEEVTVRCDFRDDVPGIVATISFLDEVPGIGELISELVANHGEKTQNGPHRIQIAFDSNLTAARVMVRIVRLIKALY